MQSETLPQISPNDRFSFAMLMAIAVHAIVILGVGFQYSLNAHVPASTIEVILVNTKTEQAPEDAEVIADQNQLQSGSKDVADRPSSPSLNRETLIGEQRQAQAETMQTQVIENQPELIVHRKAVDAELNASDTPTETIDTPTQLQQNERKKEQELAKLVSELNKEERQYAKRPRINHIDTLSAKTAVEAKYIKEWVAKVEATGNINYPDAARRKNLSGTLIMSVLINKDGSIVNTQIISSSGNRVLDKSAQHIVELAAPYRQFDQEMREEYDQLMITRTWVFHTDNRLQTE